MKFYLIYLLILLPALLPSVFILFEGDSCSSEVSFVAYDMQEEIDN